MDSRLHGNDKASSSGEVDSRLHGNDKASSSGEVDSRLHGNDKRGGERITVYTGMTKLAADLPCATVLANKEMEILPKKYLHSRSGV